MRIEKSSSLGKATKKAQLILAIGASFLAFLIPTFTAPRALRYGRKAKVEISISSWMAF